MILFFRNFMFLELPQSNINQWRYFIHIKRSSQERSFHVHVYFSRCNQSRILYPMYHMIMFSGLNGCISKMCKLSCSWLKFGTSNRTWLIFNRQTQGKKSDLLNVDRNSLPRFKIYSTKRTTSSKYFFMGICLIDLVQVKQLLLRLSVFIVYVIIVLRD